MKFKTLALASVAVVALSGGAYAKTLKHDAKADAQEAIVTQQLNQQQLSSPGSMPTAQATTQSSDQLAMNSNTSADSTATTSANTDVAANTDTSAKAPTTSVDSSASTTVAANDTKEPIKDSTAPKTDLGKATTAAGNEIDQASMAKNPVTSADLQAAVSLKGISSETLKTAEVKNRSGEALGEVNSVKVDSAGQVQAINAEVGGFLGVGERVVALDANNLVYVKDRNLIVTNMTKDEIGKLPPVTK